MVIVLFFLFALRYLTATAQVFVVNYFFFAPTGASFISLTRTPMFRTKRTTLRPRIPTFSFQLLCCGKRGKEVALLNRAEQVLRIPSRTQGRCIRTSA
jgi:hypothetical protein